MSNKNDFNEMAYYGSMNVCDQTVLKMHNQAMAGGVFIGTMIGLMAGKLILKAMGYKAKDKK